MSMTLCSFLCRAIDSVDSTACDGKHAHQTPVLYVLLARLLGVVSCTLCESIRSCRGVRLFDQIERANRRPWFRLDTLVVILTYLANKVEEPCWVLVYSSKKGQILTHYKVCETYRCRVSYCCCTRHAVHRYLDHSFGDERTAGHAESAWNHYRDLSHCSKKTETRWLGRSPQKFVALICCHR